MDLAVAQPAHNTWKVAFHQKVWMGAASACPFLITSGIISLLNGAVFNTDHFHKPELHSERVRKWSSVTAIKCGGVLFPPPGSRGLNGF